MGQRAKIAARLGGFGLMALALLVAAQGCKSTEGDKPTKGGAPAKLVIAAVAGDEDLGLKAVAPLYEKETGIKIEIIESPYPQLYEKLVTTFQAGGQTIDMAMVDDPWMPKICTEGWLEPLDALGFTRDPDIAPVIYDVGTWPPPKGPVPPSEKSKEKHLYGITIVGNVEMFAYRKDVEAAPKSWDDVLAASKKVHKAGYAGYVIRGSATNPIVADWLPILWSFGGDIFDANWKCTLTSENAVKAASFLVKELKAVAQSGPESTDAADRSRLLAIGQAHQSTIWPGEVTGFAENPKISKVMGKLDYIPMPAGPSGKGYGMMGNWLLVIPKGSPNAKASAAFITWLTSKKIQQAYTDGGGIPSRTSILKDPEMVKKHAYFSALADSLAAGPNWRPRTDQWNAVESAIGTNLNAALAGQQSAEDAMSKTCTQVGEIMKKAGY
jgi:multiple sugar transport system substrate-binding protein